MKLSEIAKLLGKRGGQMSVKSRLGGLTSKEISDKMRAVRYNKFNVTAMRKKGLIKFEGKTYWLDLGTGSGDFEFKILEDENWRPVKKGEADVFSVMETGKVIGDKKPE